MLTVTIYELDGQVRFMVHKGQDAEDVTDQYEVHAMAVETPAGIVNGWHIGTRTSPEQVLGDPNIRPLGEG